jgi:hypothetical protein
LSEEVIEQLMDHVANTGRLPEPSNIADREIIFLATKTFGSLQNALKIAGLLASEESLDEPNKVSKKRIVIQEKSNHKITNKYPHEFFLHFLNLSHYSGDWWERRANANYKCSSCKQIIDKGEHYIGRKILYPGMRGPYGHRGRYETNYFHITCLLKQSKDQEEKNVNQCLNEISNLRSQILDLKRQTILNDSNQKQQEQRILKAHDNYGRSHGLSSISKWFSMKLTESSAKKEINRLQVSTQSIQNMEVPFRNGRIDSFNHQKDQSLLKIKEISIKIDDFSQ